MNSHDTLVDNTCMNDTFMEVEVDTYIDEYQYLDIARTIYNTKYRTMMIQYHSFIIYVLENINQYMTYQSNMKINKYDIFYEDREKMLEMIINTFYLFDVYVKIIEDEYFICVNWENYMRSSF